MVFVMCSTFDSLGVAILENSVRIEAMGEVNERKILLFHYAHELM